MLKEYRERSSYRYWNVPVGVQKRGEGKLQTYVKHLPKKLRQRLLKRRIVTPELEYVTGWRVYFIEGPNWRGISWLGAIVHTLSVMIAVVYSVVRKDPSSGFTIGAFIMSLWIAWTTALYYQWQDFSLIYSLS
jgi:hypothetical protein